MKAECERCGQGYEGVTHWNKGDRLICPPCKDKEGEIYKTENKVRKFCCDYCGDWFGTAVEVVFKNTPTINTTEINKQLCSDCYQYIMHKLD